MRSSRHWAACGICWAEAVGIFSFLSGKKEEDAPSPGASDLGHEGGVAEAGVEQASAEVVAPPGPPDIPTDIDTPVSRPHEAGRTASDHAPSPDSPFHAPDAWNTEALTAPRPETAGEKPAMGPVDPSVTAELQPRIVEAVKTVYDPEIPVDIYELGLIYGIEADAEGRVLVNMTLTSPACPSAQQLPSEVRYKVKAIPGVKDAWVEIVWDPPWDKDRMSEAAKLQLGFF
jgi:FeS assembly SUF system protein